MKKLLFAFLFATACASTPKAEVKPIGPTAADYAPLQIGKSWTYQVSYPGQKGEMTVTIKDQKDGFYIDDREGAFKLTQDGLRDKQRYLIRHPLTKDATWKTVVSASAVEHNKIVSIGETCSCMAGGFDDCLVIESSIRRDAKVTLIVRWTWAKGIGLVKLETEADIVGQGRVPQVKQSLIRYSAAPTQKPEIKENGDDGPDSWTK
jgi:hypothetical protein